MLRKVLKGFGMALGGLVGLLLLAAAVLYIIGGAKLAKKYELSVARVAVPTDAGAIQRGQHLADILICTRCHLENLSGQDYFSIPGMLSVPTPNLTRGAGGVGAFYTDEDWVRAIRHGVGRDGRGLFIMASTAYQYLSDEDLGALIAYITSIPPVDNTLPERRFELVGRLMMGTSMIPPLAAETIDHAGPRPPAPQPGVTTAYGEYLSRTCHECHGERLNGIPFGPPGQEVLSPNLTLGGELAAWSETDFIQTMRTGRRPDNRLLNDEMPWKFYGKMTDAEFKAVWQYLRSLPARAHGEK